MSSRSQTGVRIMVRRLKACGRRWVHLGRTLRHELGSGTRRIRCCCVRGMTILTQRGGSSHDPPTTDRHALAPGGRHAAVRLLIGTKKAAFIYTADERRETWRVSDPIYTGWSVYHMAADLRGGDVRLYAAANHWAWGPSVAKSDRPGQDVGLSQHGARLREGQRQGDAERLERAARRSTASRASSTRARSRRGSSAARTGATRGRRSAGSTTASTARPGR